MEQKDWINLLGQALTTAGFLFVVFKYIKEKQREFKKRFFEEQLKIFTEAVDYASCIPLYDKDTTEYRNAVLNFRRLFWGKMCVVEDRDVESKMINFNRLLEQYETTSDIENREKIRESLQQAGLTLAHTCRNSTLHTWGVSDKLKGYNDYSLNTEADYQNYDC